MKFLLKNPFTNHHCQWPQRAAKPPPRLNSTAVEDSAAVTAGVEGAAITAEVATASEPVAKVDFSFAEKIELPIEQFIKLWSMAYNFKHKYALGENWPAETLIWNSRNAASAVLGLVHIALWKVGAACQRGC